MDQFDEKDSTPFDIEETIDELEYELGYMVIGCDFNGDCLLEHGFDFFAEEGCTTVSYTHLTLPTNREV